MEETVVHLNWVTKPLAEYLHLMKKSKYSLQCFQRLKTKQNKPISHSTHNLEQKKREMDFFCPECSAVFRTSLQFSFSGSRPIRSFRHLPGKWTHKMTDLFLCGIFIACNILLCLLAMKSQSSYKSTDWDIIVFEDSEPALMSSFCTN